MSSGRLGDAIRALGVALPGEEASALSLLGWAFRERVAAQERAVVERPEVPRPQVGNRPEKKAPPAGPSAALRIEALRPGRPRAPLRPIQVAPSGRLATPEALLDPVRTRSVVSTIGGQRGRDGALDVRALVRAMAARRPVARLPRQLRPSLRRGVVLAVDTGDALAPFREDVRGLLTQLERWTLAEKLSVRRFRGVPDLLDAGEGPEAWLPQAEGPTLLVLTGPGASIAAWCTFAEEMAGTPWVILSPYPSHRWPAVLGATLPIVAWDRGLTATQVRAARRA